MSKPSSDYHELLEQYKKAISEIEILNKQIEQMREYIQELMRRSK